MKTFLLGFLWIGINLLRLPGGAWAEQPGSDVLPEHSPRRSPVVDVVARVQPSVVALFPLNEKNHPVSSGSGVVIHPRGFVLTNDHVLGTPGGIAISGRRMIRYQVVGRIPEKDLAIVKLRGMSGPAAASPMGHSYDIRTGETVAAFGNPSGRGIIVTTGIVSSPSLTLSFPSALTAFQYPDSRRDDFVQFDAAINPGNSGGPLVNLDGEVIGVVSRVAPGEQNAGFAIPIDRVRQLMPRLMEAELVRGRVVGVTLQPQADRAVVAAVMEQSPAAAAGVLPGDIIERLNDQTIEQPYQWPLLLWEQLENSQPISLNLRRGDDRLRVTVVPAASIDVPGTAPFVGLGDDAVGQTEGLRYEMIDGVFTTLPGAEPWRAAGESRRVGVLPKPTLDFEGRPDDRFAMRLSGAVKLPEDGLYRVTLNSDDGSRLTWQDRRIIENDGTHPPTDSSRRIAATAGWHPIEIEYFESVGEQALSFRIERLDAMGENVPGAEPIELLYRCEAPQ